MESLYRRIGKYLPDCIKNDFWFDKKNFSDNSLFLYHPAWDCNRQKFFSDKLFFEIHRLQKILGLLNNFIDRKLARWQYAVLARKYAGNAAVSKNKIFRNKHVEQRCFIIGNGPSLAKQDLAPLADETTFVSKAFWQHPILSKDWQPSYYCNFHVENFYDQQGNLIGSDNPELEKRLAYFKLVRERMPNTIYFIPFYGLEANKKYKFLPEERTFYLPFLPYSIFEFLPNWPDLSCGMPGAQDTSQYSIMMAMAMGFKEIILLGCDQTDYMVRGETQHFYQGPALSNEKERFNSALLPVLDMNIFNLMVWRGHINLKKMAEVRGVKIINATGGGILDVYQLGCYEDIVSSLKNKTPMF